MEYRKNILFYVIVTALLSIDTLSAESVITSQALAAGGADVRIDALGRIEGAVGFDGLDISYLSGLKACAIDPSPEVRKKTAQVIGMFFVAGKEQLDDGVEELLIKLANDQSSAVRYAAVYFGLADIKSKSNAVVEQLLTEATTTRNRKLYDKIVGSLSSNHDQAAVILDQKITEPHSKSFYTIYEAMTGKSPPPRNPSLDMVLLSVDKALAKQNSRMRLSTLKNMSRSPVDDKYLDSLILCCADPTAPVRSMSTQLICDNFVPKSGMPSMEVLNILTQMAQDVSGQVRFSAVHYGLTQIEQLPDSIFELLVDIASKEKEGALFDFISDKLSNEMSRLVKTLDGKLTGETPVNYYEIYEDLTGFSPPKTERLLDMPSSSPMLFSFFVGQKNPQADKRRLEAELTQAGLSHLDLFITKSDSLYALLLKTRVTRERLLVDHQFASHPEFKYLQKMWLTPEQEAQVDAIRIDREK